jgi:filamentous hemagglutinin
VTITDEARQQQLTGKNPEETVAGLNRDTANAQVAAQRQDVQAMRETVEAERTIKQAAFAEAAKFTDESYRKLFLEKTKMYEIVKDENGMITRRELSDAEKLNLTPGSDGKIHVTNNGIFNDLDAASKYADQLSTAVNGPQYLIYFPEANNAISELLIAGYQKFLEGDVLGLSNAVEENNRLLQQYGELGLHIDGYSRGAMTTGNTLESTQNQSATPGMLSNTTINFYGPAYNAEQADNILGALQNRDAITDPGRRNEMILQMQNHQADPIGRLVGGNPGTGGSIPEGSNTIKEAINAVGGENTVHNCYGMSDAKPCQQFWNPSPNGQPILQPIHIYFMPSRE